MFLINRLVPYMRFLICIVSFIETEEPAGSIEMLDDIQEDGNPGWGLLWGLAIAFTVVMTIGGVAICVWWNWRGR